MKGTLTILIPAFFIVLAVSLGSQPEKYVIQGIVDGVRLANEVTILLKKRPDRIRYYLLDGNEVIGTVMVVEVLPWKRSEYPFRALCTAMLDPGESADRLFAGLKVGLRSAEKTARRSYEGIQYLEKKEYRKRVFGSVDRREMLLIPGGKAEIGTESGPRESRPRHRVHVPDFYLDRYEVSNDDYYRYVHSAQASPPRSWEGDRPGEGAGDLPVLVSYHEARAYAKWAGKRLPTEFEWEKAAGGGKGRWPWGDFFDASRCNGRPFWTEEENRDRARKEWSIHSAGPLPVYALGEDGVSPFGVVNMAGNVREWTSSVFQAYEGNRQKNRKFGTLYRVIRGGAWYSSPEELTVTFRFIGGIPNLQEDNVSGFRCARDVKRDDRVDLTE